MCLLKPCEIEHQKTYIVGHIIVFVYLLFGGPCTISNKIIFEVGHFIFLIFSLVVLKKTIVLIDGISCAYDSLDNLDTYKDTIIRLIHYEQFNMSNLHKWIEKLTKITNNPYTLEYNTRVTMLGNLTYLLTYGHLSRPFGSCLLLMISINFSCSQWGLKYHTFDGCFLGIVCSLRFVSKTKFVKWYIDSPSLILKYITNLLPCLVIQC